MNSIRTVKKLQPPNHQTFDQQFWPVLVALTVLCGIGIGAIVTLIHGTWMWISLLLLPTLSVLTIYLLARLDDSRLRRSLQLAIISSLAFHLFCLVIASAISIFRQPARPQPESAATPTPRTIEISDRRTQFVWEEPNRHETPEPEVEEVRKETPATDLQPQPIAVEEVAPSPAPQIVRRSTPAESIPRLDKTLSELKRQRENLQPTPHLNRASRELTATNATKATAEPKEAAKSEPVEMASENAMAASAVKRSESAEPTFERTKPVPSETKPAVKLADAAPPHSPSLPLPQFSAAQSSRSSTLRTAPAPNLAQTQPKREPSETNEPVPSETPPEPAPMAAEMTRRTNSTEVMQPSALAVNELQRSIETPVAQSAQRRPTELAIPSITSETSTRVEPRRSATEAPTPTTTVAVERPNLPAASSSTESEFNPKTLSVTRSTSGVAGVGRSENLASATGGAASPALKSSDSSSRAESQNQPSDLRQLVASQLPAVRRATQAAVTPSHSLKADTSERSNVTGSSMPTERTLEAAAAQIQSSRSEARSEVSVERGSATVDLGPTKVLPDVAESQRRSGGGRPEISQLNPENSARSPTIGQLQPSLAATAARATLAPTTQSSMPVTSELQPNTESTMTTRSAGQQPTTMDRDTSTLAGAHSNAGSSPRAVDFAPAQPRSASRQQTANPMSQLEQGDVLKQGNRRTEVSAAPNLRGDSGLGNSAQPTGSSVTHSETQTQFPGESKVEMARTMAAENAGTGVGRTPTSESIESTSRQNLAESTAPRRVPNAEQSDIGNVIREQTGESNSRRDSRLASNGLNPKLAVENSALANSPAKTNSNVGEDSAAEQASATNVELGRTNSAAANQGFALDIVAMDGSPGLSKQPDDSLGMPTRPSEKNSLQVQPKLDSRLRRPDFGGTPAIHSQAAVAKEAFRNRASSVLISASEPSTEAAIHLGLQFLARNQNPDGSWSLGNFDRDHPQHAAQLNSDAAATGLALLAFQGAGYNHREFKYATVLRRGIYWLIENQQDNGCLYVEADKQSNDSCRMYSHGIAALALTEAYGMTQDPKLKEPAQRAMAYIINTQDASKGGWRYFDDPSRRSADTSVSGWMMMALHSGRLVGLDVDESVFEGIDKWLDLAVDPDDASKFRYNPYLVDTEGISRTQGRRATPSMTAVGLLMRIYNGMDSEDPVLRNGTNWLVRNYLPSDATPDSKDTYYWYYATQVLKYVDGPLWEQWDRRLRPLLIQSQIKTGEMAGSWHPYNPIPDRWGAFGGRLYVTTMNLLSLEVRHRMLPLYQKTNR